MKSILRKFAKFVLLPLIIVAFIWVGYFLIFGNFHKVDKDVYRSAQLFSFNMPYYIKKYKIKSILNLRSDTDKKWHKDELNFSKEHNLTHYDYPIGDRSMASIKSMDKIVDLIKKAPKPLLIHCKAGADRTSLGVALYLHEIKKDKNAKDSISIIYGHFPWFGSRTVAMDRSFENYIKRGKKDGR